MLPVAVPTTTSARPSPSKSPAASDVMVTPAPPNRAAGVVAKPFHVDPSEPSLRKTSPVAAIDQASPLRSAVAFRSSFRVVALGAALIV